MNIEGNSTKTIYSPFYTNCFFPERISLLTILFPLFSLSLCSWMTVFGFYLRLEDLAKREEKKKLAKEVLEKGFHTYWLVQRLKLTI